MKLTKFYAHRDLNFHLLPDLIGRVISSVPSPMLVTADEKELILDEYYRVLTPSQVASTRDRLEFRDILRTLDDPPIALDAEVECFFKAKHLRDYSDAPPALSFRYDGETIKISMARNTVAVIKELFGAFEETFSLTTVTPPVPEEQQVVRPRTAFVAHSFDDRGKSYAYEVIKLLSMLDFQVTTGEGYSPEGVSKKVKRRLLAQEVVIAVLSRKDDSTWLTQETAGAAFTDKPLILMIEEGVTLKPGVLGDLEYIRFSEGQISMAFVPLLEGLQELGYRIG